MYYCGHYLQKLTSKKVLFHIINIFLKVIILNIIINIMHESTRGTPLSLTMVRVIFDSKKKFIFFLGNC